MEQALREDIVRHCRLLHQRGYLAANDGNVSSRLDGNRVLVTPSGVHKGFLEPGDLIVVDLKGNKLSGTREPTGEIALHLRALAQRPDATAVVHAHPPLAIAMSLTKKKLDGILPEVTLSLGRLQVVPYARPLTDDLAKAVAAALEHSDAVILERHGTVAVGRTIAEAYGQTERIEHASQVLWSAYALAAPRPVDEAEQRALLRMYESSRLKR
ncbi:MAG: class II aldolase/adducin family protein [Archangium sp.]|nr:class II aldolase/adducin family protein [Archangium sp.]